MSFRNEDGFTILEILVSIAILSITIIPLVGLFSTAVVIHAQREQQTRTAFLAQLRLEEVKQKATYDFSTDYSIPETSGGDPGGFSAPDDKYKYTIIDDNDTDLREITIQVWYDENDDNTVDPDEQNVTLDTLVARRW